MTRIVRTLLDGLIDYAGLFPPAGLAMADAAAKYAAYRRGPHAWMLGRFVVSCARLEEFADAAAGCLPSGPDAIPWRLSALAGSDLAADAAAIDAFNRQHGDMRDAGRGAARIDTLEVKLTPDVEIAEVVARLPSTMAIWFEIAPGPSLGADLLRIAESGHGAKLRTGGVTPALIPSSAAVAQVLLGCARAGVALKATAGLHHPIRAPHRLTYADDSPTAVMHGFVNLFVAAALARDLVLHGAPDPEAQATVVALLDDRDPRAFTWRDEAVLWRRHRIDEATMTDVRARLARSFGSCSFEEPIAELQQLGCL